MKVNFKYGNISDIPAELENGTIYVCKDNGVVYYDLDNRRIPTSASMTILSYGHSTWDEFLAAYKANLIVYCRASSNSNPGTGSQNRMAFMAYIAGTVEVPTEVEFQYYRSMSSHTASNQGDQVYVYKLTNKGVWSVTVREAATKILTGTGLTSTFAAGVNSTITLRLTDAVVASLDKADTAYQKPDGGIPSSDLADAPSSISSSTIEDILDGTYTPTS